MDSRQNRKPVVIRRVDLTDDTYHRLLKLIKDASVPGLARRTGLPYLLIYNLSRRRVKSLSARHYRIIFGSDPPALQQRKTDGTRFRQMVDLYLFFNERITKSDLYREFYGGDRSKRVDYRIFTGQTQSVDPEFIQYLEQKFEAAGIDQATVGQWAAELDQRESETLIPYDRVRPMLIFLYDRLGIHPTSILNQWFKRYETGELKSVSVKIYRKISAFKQKAEKALDSGSRSEIELLKEEIYGRKPGYTLYVRIEEELLFLHRHARKSLKKYLGRSTSMYTTGECRRLPSWRARKIMDDCRAFIRQHPHLPLAILPCSMRKQVGDALLMVLTARTADLLSCDEGIRLEKRILKPSHASEEYKKKIYGFTRFDMACRALGMKKSAFDLMVAKNCEIFRKIGTYSQRWYLSDLYLKELSQKRYFDLITAKYEWLARRTGPDGRAGICMN